MLDSTTLWAAIAAAAVVIGSLQVMQFLLQRDETSMLLWGSAKLIGAVGASLMAARGLIPDILSVTGANMIIVLAVSLNAVGMVSFNGDRVRLPMIALPPITMTLGYLATPGIYENIAAQTYINGLCVVAAMSWAAVRTHRANAVDPLVWRRGLAIALWLWVATMLSRMVASIWMPGATDPTGSTATQSITALMLMILVVMTGVLEMLASRERVDHRLAEAALRDPQTGAYNRAGLHRRLVEIAGADSLVSVMLMDLDDFKAVNDHFGHPVGDDVLEAFVAITRHHLRSGDVLARYGGDEFCVLLPDTSAHDAAQIGERIRIAFSTRFDGVADAVRCSVSIGVSDTRLVDTDAFDAVVSAADSALYDAKQSSRGVVRTVTPSRHGPASRR